MYLFIDTETTGLNKNSDHVVQIAWILAHDQYSLHEQECFIIRPDGYLVPPQAAKIHKITTERALREGVPLASVLSALSKAAAKSNVLIAHNLTFDVGMLESSYRRAVLDYPLDRHAQICTMKSSAQWCAIPHYSGRSGYKWPKLTELHERLFGHSFAGAHDALSDVKACMRCYFELVRRGVIAARSNTAKETIKSVSEKDAINASHKAKHINETPSQKYTKENSTMNLEEKNEKKCIIEKEISPRSLASNPSTPASILVELFYSDLLDQAIAKQLAGNPSTPDDVLSCLVEYENFDEEIAEKLAENPSSSEYVLDTLIDSDYVDLLTPKLLSHTNCPSEFIDKNFDEIKNYFRKSPDEARSNQNLIRKTVIPLARNQNSDSDFLISLYWMYSDHPDVLNALKENDPFIIDTVNHTLQLIDSDIADGLILSQKTNHDILSELAKHEDTDVRLQVARRANLPAEIINDLAVDDEYQIRLAIAQREDISDIVRRGLIFDKSYNVREAALKKDEKSIAKALDYGLISLKFGDIFYEFYNKNFDLLEKISYCVSDILSLEERKLLASRHDCPTFIQCLLALDESPKVRLALLANIYCSIDALKVFARDPIYEWRVLSAEHANCSDELLKELSSDKNPKVRKIANLKRSKNWLGGQAAHRDIGTGNTRS